MSQSHLFYSQKFFFRAFPPPKFLLMSSVGIDISDHAVRFLELIPNQGAFKLGRFGEQTIPDGVISYGEIKDLGTLKTALIGLRRDHNLSYVRASLPEEKAFLFRQEIPDFLSEEEIRENISYQLEEHVPIKPEDAEFDYCLAESIFAKNSPDTREILVSVFPKATVESYLDAYRSAGLMPLSFEMEGTALARSLVPFGDLGTYMIVDIGRFRTGISIVSKGAVNFTSTVEVGGETITEAIERHLKVTRDEAEKLKVEGAFSRNGRYREIFPILLDSLGQLTEQINKHYIYWHNHPDKKDSSPPAIEKIIVSGGDANLEGFSEHLSLSMRTGVVTGNVWVNAFSTEEYIPPLSRAPSLSYAVAIGLSLREE